MTAAPTTFHLVRHGDYDLVGRVLAGRTPGHSLNASGRAQALALAGVFADMPIAALASSPLERTRETAAPIAERLGLPVEIEPGITEIDFGQWSGTGFGALHAEPDWLAFNSFRAASSPPGGETMVAAQARGMESLLKWRSRLPGRHVVMVSHADLIKSVLCLILGMPLDLMRRIEIGPGSRSIVTMWDEDARVELINQPPPG